MSARSVDEINITNFETLSINPLRAQFDLELKWTRENGTSAEYNATHIWPDDILPGGVEVMPSAVWQEFIIQMITAAIRVNRGVSEWDEHS
jgi:hypothetical protein